jgi:hypothetical protein
VGFVVGGVVWWGGGGGGGGLGRMDTAQTAASVRGARDQPKKAMG